MGQKYIERRKIRTLSLNIRDNSDFSTFLAVDWSASRRLLREKRGAGDPTGAGAEE